MAACRSLYAWACAGTASIQAAPTTKITAVQTRIRISLGRTGPRRVRRFRATRDGRSWLELRQAAFRHQIERPIDGNPHDAATGIHPPIVVEDRLLFFPHGSHTAL